MEELEKQLKAIQETETAAYEAGYKKGYDDAVREYEERYSEHFDLAYDNIKDSPHCTKCGEPVLGDENSLCGKCV